MPAASAKNDGSNTREDIYKISTTTNFVQVPVTVKDQDGKLVSGLVPKDFQVLENGKPQKMAFFTSDPFPLSAAVVIDLGMPDSLVQKVNRTFSALEGAFSQFDEVSLYTYSSTTTRLTGFSAAGQELVDTLNELKTKRGRNDGVPVTSGPFGPQGPVINGTPVTSPVPILSSPPKESHVINDAILAAALDLSKRDRSRRKIIFVISDGRESGSNAGYSDVLKVLLTIMLSSMDWESAELPRRFTAGCNESMFRGWGLATSCPSTLPLPAANFSRKFRKIISTPSTPVPLEMPETSTPSAITPPRVLRVGTGRSRSEWRVRIARTTLLHASEPSPKRGTIRPLPLPSH